jgi:hypothetical protein
MVTQVKIYIYIYIYIYAIALRAMPQRVRETSDGNPIYGKPSGPMQMQAACQCNNGLLQNLP